MYQVPFNPRKYAAARWTECGRVYPTLDCWGFVRAVLLECAGIELERFDGKIAKHMDKCFISLVWDFDECEPCEHAIACFFTPHGVLCHVGIVEGGRVWQLDAVKGLISDDISKFQDKKSVRFYIHGDLKNAH